MQIEKENSNFGPVASLIIRLFQPEECFFLPINQPEQCFGLFFQRNEWNLYGDAP